MTVVAESTPRQTIPYGYRPIVKSNLRATDDFYQFLERLRVSTSSTIQNITNIIIQTNANEAQIQALQVEVTALQNALVLIEEEIAALQAQTPTDTPPPLPPLPIQSGFPPWPVSPPPVALSAPAVVAVLTVDQFLGLDFTNAPTADPGGGRLWLKTGNLHFGA